MSARLLVACSALAAAGAAAAIRAPWQSQGYDGVGSTAGPSRVGYKVLLTDAAANNGAVCLDGACRASASRARAGGARRPHRRVAS